MTKAQKAQLTDYVARLQSDLQHVESDIQAIRDGLNQVIFYVAKQPNRDEVSK